MPTTITLKGFKEFQQKLKNLPGELKKEVDLEVQDSAQNWSARAQRDAPVDQGLLKGQITSRHTGLMKAEVISGAEYSAYVEWGTKTRVKVPSELQSYAAQFRGGKSTGKAKEFIYAWMKRVGVPEDKQWIVFISIVTKGIHPHPFFFIQRPVVEKELIDNLENLISVDR